MTNWKHIPFLPAHFEASEEGLIRTRERESVYIKDGVEITRRIPGRVLESHIGKVTKTARDFKPVVTIHTPGEKRRSKIHAVDRLVACAHLGMPYDRSNQREIQRWKIVHKDGDLTHCAVENLEWVYNAKTDAYVKNLQAHRNSDPKSVLGRLFAA